MTFEIYPKVNATILNEEIFCRIARSKIHGVGIIAMRPIPAGTQYNQHWNELYGRRVQISYDEWDKVDEPIKDLILDSGCFTDGIAGYYLVEHPNSHHCLFANHSDDPNTDAGVALRDIATGEEITRYVRGVHEKVIEHFTKKGIIIKS